MLKWLVQKSDVTNSLTDLVTDDPLATLNFGGNGNNGGNNKRRKGIKEIYSVNR